MGTTVEQLAHFQEQRAARPVPGLPDAVCGKQLCLDPQVFAPASLLTRLVGHKEVVAIPAGDQTLKLAGLVELAQRVHQDTGLETLWIVLGTLTPLSKDTDPQGEQSLPLLCIPILAAQDAHSDWHVHHHGTKLVLSPVVLALKQEDADQDESLRTCSDHRAWWAALSAHLIKDAELNAKYRVDLNCAYLATLSRAHCQIAQDLDPQRWGDEAILGSHPVLSPLLGPGFLSDQRQNSFTAPYLSGQESPCAQLWIEDADQFQAQAILAASSGESVVIQGPCGTGKTQTLTNIVGSLVAQGRKVLLLSQSRKDLQALEQRLRHARLGHACLSLYDQSMPNHAPALDIMAALSLGAPTSPDRTALIARHQELHDQLNRYANAIREPLGKSGWCYQEVVGRLLAIKHKVQGGGLPKLGFDPIAHWTQDDFVHAKELVNELVTHIEQHGTIGASTFCDIDLGALTPEHAGDWCDRIAQLAAQAQLLVQSCDAVFSELKLDPPSNFNELGQWVRAFDVLGTRPDLGGLQLDRELWSAKAATAIELLASARLCESIKLANQEHLLDAAWDADVMSLRSALRDQGDKWWRKASKRWRQAKSELQALVRGELPAAPERALSLVEAIVHYQSEQRTTQRLASMAASLFGPHWNGEDSDWDHLETCTEWLTAQLDEIKAQQLPAQMWQVLNIDATALASAAELSQRYTNLDEQLQELAKETGVSLHTESLEALEQRFVNWSEQRSELVCALNYRTLEGKLRGVGLSALVPLAQSWSYPLDLMVPAVELAYLAGLEALAFSERHQLRDATSARLDAFRAEFSALDRKLPALAQEQLNAKLFAQRPAPDTGALLDLKQALQDPRQRSDLSHLLAEHWDIIRAFTPIVLATPASLAGMFTDPACTFDTVVIDSAGTMPLYNAMGGILRAKQVIAVGDSRQSPCLSTTTTSEPKSKHLINAAQSILHRCKTQGAAEYLLSLHYRSRHDSLINFVNQTFYEGALKVPPSPATATQDLGLYWHPPKVPGACDDHTLGINRQEANQVAAAIAQQLLQFPEQSLGVVALSQAQAQEIEQALKAQVQEHPELAALLCPQRDEAFFVQPLEAASREDRSVIFLSLGYGVDAKGAISSRWGALAGSEGHRKLSIALTRARLKMQVFGNIEAQHLHRDEHTPTGLSILSGFLEQAQNCSQRIFESAVSTEHSAFAHQVRAAIVELGYSVRSPTGEHEVDADLYVYDPEHPEIALVGILCDTPRYHRQKVARDRERIALNLLYHMGWKLQRVWCRDWLADPEKEVRRLADTLTGLSSKVPWSASAESTIGTMPLCANEQDSTPQRLRSQIDRAAPQANEFASSIYKRSCEQLPLGRLECIDELAHVDLAAAIVVALQVEGEMHQELLNLRLAQSLGRFASSPALRDAVAAAVDRTLRNNQIHRKGAFFSLPGQQSLPVRTRAALPLTQRRLDWVPPKELDLALMQAAARQPNAPIEQILTMALDDLGLLCVGAKARSQICKRVQELDGAEKLRPKPATDEAA